MIHSSSNDSDYTNNSNNSSNRVAAAYGVPLLAPVWYCQFASQDLRPNGPNPWRS